VPDGANREPATGPSFAPFAGAIAGWLGTRLGAATLTLDAATLLPGGAIQHNWRLDVTADGAARTLVLRAGPDIPLPESIGKAREFDLLRRAWLAGVPVAEPLLCADGDPAFDRDFLVSAFVAGDAERGGLWASPDSRPVVADLGAALAAVHRVAPPDGVVPERPADRVATLAGWALSIADVPEGVRSGLGWLRAHAPATGAAALVHRDFRTGNFLVYRGRLAAVLDWEFAGWGDPQEDIGWFCARCWRGPDAAREAGGLGGRAAFYEAYARAGGVPIDDSRVRFWEVFAHVRWALIAMQQGERARAGAWPAGELEEAAARVPGLAGDIALEIAA
jgi:aminoglycoside phosphotransferase (APT) family kinase protein